MTRPILVFGAGGQVGRALEMLDGIPKRPLRHSGFVFVEREACDITQPAAVHNVVHSRQPAAIINCAVFRNVEAEVVDEEVNSAAALAMVAGDAGVPFVQLSTDYVFDGAKGEPYTETDEPNPLSPWAWTKLRGEESTRECCESHIILRTSWLYGPYGRNFLKTMRAKAEAGETLRVVNDQQGTPTFTGDLARAILTAAEGLIADPSVSGTYHFAGPDVYSWFTFAQEIVGPAVTVEPISTAESGARVARPAYSALNSDKFAEVFGLRHRPTQECLAELLS